MLKKIKQKIAYYLMKLAALLDKDYILDSEVK